MESYLQIEKLTKSYGDRILFEDVTLGIFQGDKIGIIAPNGAGKTTFLNIIAGKEDYDSGNVVFRNGLRVGYLEQLPPMDGDMTVLEYVASGVEWPRPCPSVALSVPHHGYGCTDWTVVGRTG